MTQRSELLRDLRVLVTGGTSGLGRALVDEFSARGAQVAFVARRAADVDRVARECPDTLGIVGDVSRSDAVHRIALQALAWRGGLDVLVNNASSLGQVPLAPLADTESEGLEEALATNVLGPFRLTKALYGALAASSRDERGGIVVNVTSDAAINAYANWGAYGASKAALSHLTRIFDEESRALGIRMLAVDPGDMDARLHALALPDADRSGAQTAANIGTRARRCRARARGVEAQSQGRRAHVGCSSVRMIAADRPVPRPATAKLLLVDADGRISTTQRSRWTSFLECGDVVIANDAATLPASLKGSHVRTGRAIEVRLAAWCRGAPASTIEFDAVVFGDGDHRTPTEQRSLPPLLAPNDVLMLGPLCATIVRTLDHPRLVRLRFNATGRGFWLALAEHGRPIQYAYMREALGLRDVWTSIANVPVAFEAPSAGFILDWQTIESLAQRRVRFATLTHAAGISSTGDADLDRRLPFAEWYDIPATTAAIVNRAIRSGGRVIAIGTTVVRALEDASR
jgi:S-adenosylmethionine:tRNA ribosyltransferase-isomerase